MNDTRTVLVVDDEPKTKAGIVKTLEAQFPGKLRIAAADSGIEALEWLGQNEANVIVTDIRMPEMDGLKFIETAVSRSRGRKPVFLVLSGHPVFDYAKKAIELGVVEYLVKPVGKDELRRAVDHALKVEEERRRVETMGKLVDPKLLESNGQVGKVGPQVRDAMQFVDEHLHEAIGMSQVAERLHLNPSYFSVLFKEQTGITFSEYLSRKRIQRAKELLVQTNLPVADIAERVGYQTAKYFIKVFKSYEDVSPTQYRADVRNVPGTI